MNNGTACSLKQFNELTARVRAGGLHSYVLSTPGHIFSCQVPLTEQRTDMLPL